MLRMLLFLLLISIMGIAISCGSNGQTNNDIPQENVSQNDPQEETNNEPPPQEDPPQEIPEPESGIDKNTIIVILTTNADLIEEHERQQFIEAINEKWIKDKKSIEMTTDNFYANMAQYEGNIILRADILRIYGDFEVNVRAVKVIKDGDEYVEAPYGKGAWRRRSMATPEDVCKEIKYADNVLAEK